MKVESLPTQKSSTQHSFTADVEIVDENWVTIDSEIVNATPVVANSEIGSGDEFFFCFTSSLRPSIMLMLVFPLPMFLTLSRHRTHRITLYSSSNNTNINTSSFSKVFPIHSFQHWHLALLLYKFMHSQLHYGNVPIQFTNTCSLSWFITYPFNASINQSIN